LGLREELRQTPSFLKMLLGQWRKPADEGVWEARGEELDFTPRRKELSLREVIEAALRNNAGIQVERLNPWLSREDVRKADAVFDPLLSLSSSTERSNLPKAFGLSGVEEKKGVLIHHDRHADLTVKKTLRTGGDLSISLANERLLSNSIFQQLNPELGSHLKISLNQPLLRNFGIEFAVILVRIAENSHGITIHDLRAKLSDLAQKVTQAYWEVALLRESVKAEQEGLMLAQELRRENEVRFRAGVIARVEVKEAEAEVRNREANLIVAQNALNLARENLRQLVQFDGDRVLLPAMIEPLDSPQALPYPEKPELVLKNALERRAELMKARVEIKNRHALTRYNENQLLPKLNLELTYGQNGLSGRPRPCDPKPCDPPGAEFRGKFKDAFGDALSKESHQFFTGLTLEIPFDNAQAKSAYARSRIEARQAEARYRDVVSQVLVDVKKTYGDAESGWRRIQVTRIGRELAEEKLDDQEKRHRVGLATTFDLLRFQKDLTDARVAEVKALVEYNIALSNLRRAEGSLLAHHNIQFEEERIDRKPWWARF
jgi:outer membrane protein TolC